MGKQQSSKQSSNKGNPAHRRMSNLVRKARRTSSHLRSRKRKEQRRAESLLTHRANVVRRAAGEPTP